MEIFDVGIIGAGVAGSMAAYKLAKDHKKTKVIVFDIGRPPAKRRSQMHGWLGCLPSSDGKFYTRNIDLVSNLIGDRKSKAYAKLVNELIENVCDFKIIKDKQPNQSLIKKIKKENFSLELNNYFQLYPKDIHALSRFMSNILENNSNITYSFDNEIFNITKQKGYFTVNGEYAEYKCKKLILAVGRSGWRWASSLYSNFGLIDNNDYSRYGIRVEMTSNYLKDFNKSNCTLKKDNLEIGPLSWFGTVIPEDHVDMAISSFRSNEDRWKTDKVSFSIISNFNNQGKGYQQTDRIGRLTFLLTNDRVNKEKVSTFLNKRSRVSPIPEYEYFIKLIHELSALIPEIATKAYFHVPTLSPMAPKINIGNNLESEVDGLYIAGESAGISGLYSAAIMGMIVGDSVLKS